RLSEPLVQATVSLTTTPDTLATSWLRFSCRVSSDQRASSASDGRSPVSTTAPVMTDDPMLPAPIVSLPVVVTSLEADWELPDVSASAGNTVEPVAGAESPPPPPPPQAVRPQMRNPSVEMRIFTDIIVLP